MLEVLTSRLDASGPAVVSLQQSLVAIPALGPDNGGQGELEKALFLTDYLKSLGFAAVERVDAPDSRVASGVRPNLVAVIPGQRTDKTFWVISHTDVVPAGDRSLWKTDPFTLHVDGDVMTGRGVEDNHQGIVSSLMLAKALLDAKMTPPVNYGVILVADEETGSLFGLDYVLKARPDLFHPDDLFLTPDFGCADSSMLEVAEKSILWLKIAVTGRQCHASTPSQGRNTLVASADLILRLGELYKLFPDEDALFDPAHSTFEPTRKEENVPNVNTVPGYDVFYVDCRVLPSYPLDEILASIRAMADVVEQTRDVRIEISIVQRADAAPATSVDSEIVSRLTAGIRAVYGIDARPMGIGGGTVAAFLRRLGYSCAVWATCVHNAHQPNESSLISTQLGDAKVMAHVLTHTA
ncbi:M20 family metallo-hydrolase [Megalodesulfovibrio paquesii]